MLNRSKSRVTLKDIAAATDLSINTVSRVLRGLYASPSVTKKVLAAANELGYIGNSVASSMRSGVTRTIAVIMEDLANPHYARLLRVMTRFLDDAGYTLMVCNTESSVEYEKKAIVSAIRQGVDGLLVCPYGRDPANLEFLKKQHTPFVIFNHGYPDAACSSVMLDNVKGGQLAAEYLLDKGCQNFIFVNGVEGGQTATERLAGCVQAHEQRGLHFDMERVVYTPRLFASDTAAEKAWKHITRRIMKDDAFDGLLAFSDQIALKVLERMRSNGFSRIPLDRLPMIGFDNILEIFPVPLPLSSVSYADKDVGIEAAKLLLAMLGNEQTKPCQLILDVKVYERD